jgi:hypothetical protein
MKGFNDIEGTEICEGDEILFTINYGRSSSSLRKGKVSGFTPQFMKFSTPGYTWHEKIRQDGCSDRVLVMKGEFKTYTKTEIQDHAS